MPEERKDEVMIRRRRCRICGNLGTRIMDPKESHDWICRKCYTGLSTEEITGRLRDIFKMIKNPGFVPEWLPPIQEKYMVPF